MTTNIPRESVAIVAMCGRFPGADTVDAFWQNLVNGVESIITYSDEELRAAGVDEATRSQPGFVRRGTILNGVEMFDAPFFGYSARDATVIDPQQRLFLECCWEALEDAGYDVSSYPGLIGVYAGSEQSSYLFQLWGSGPSFLDSPMASIGNDKDYLTTQVSYKLNLRGPSMAVQTACSTSLVATAAACHSLLSYQCDMALAGGTSVLVPQTKGYMYQPGGIWSPDGHCRTFDAAGQGTVVGSGIGVVVLKRLSDAIESGDHIHAVIRGAALNNDGAMKVGFGAPSIEGQAQVITLAHAIAGIEPEQIGYVEAHGTATMLGDPIEMAALTQVFRAGTSRQEFCAIGSAKSNVGHLASAAGVTGLIKAALILEREQIPPTLHFRQPNPQIDFASSPFYVNTTLRPWPRTETPRLCGISSFGVGGTNAHVVIEEAPIPTPTTPSRPHQLLVVSARTDTALERATDNLASCLAAEGAPDLADAAFTLQVGRKAFSHRRACVVADGPSSVAAAALRDREPTAILNGFSETRERPIVFLFSGQGAQYVDMARGLYDSEPVFRACVDGCCELLEPYLGFDLRPVMFPAANDWQGATELLTQTGTTQPALFTIEYSLAQLWQSWGIAPSAMLGHSIGEYVAACLSGVLSLSDALILVARRGALMQGMPAGAMLAVPLSEAELSPVLDNTLSIAALNGPKMSVVSGPAEAIDDVFRKLAARGVQSRRLQTSHAFHSAMMDPIVWPFMQTVQTVTLGAPRIPYLSNVTGTWITAESTVDPSYWARHLRGTVRFADNLAELAKVPDLVYLEVGPGQQLGTLARQMPERVPDQLILPSLRSATEDVPDSKLILTSLAQLWLGGVAVSWSGFYSSERRRRVSLPTYPFERDRYWIDPAATATEAQEASIDDWFWEPRWQPAPLAQAAARPSASASVCLLFDDGGAIGQGLATRLEAAGTQVIRVLPGAHYAHTEPGLFAIRAGNPDDYVTLLTEVNQRQIPDTIIHTWSLTPGKGANEFDFRQEHGFYSLTYLTQALQKSHVTRKLQIGVVTAGVFRVLGDETLSPSSATVLGASLVIPQEQSNYRCRTIDLAAGEQSDPKLPQRILDELAASEFEPMVAIRGGRRWVQSHQRVRVEAGSQKRLIDRGVYLITGGLGKVGMAVATALARAVQARVVLTGRSQFPDRDQWDAWISAHPAGDRVSIAIGRIRDIEHAGGEVLVVSADASSPDDMARALTVAESTFGPINGVVHAAGYTAEDGFAAIQLVDRHVVESQLNAKARSLLVLDAALGDRQLDFCLLISSLSAVLGGLNLMPYAAANAFLDAHAALANQRDGTPWISVNWDRWQFPEEGAPASADTISPEAGGEAFLRLVSHAPGQVVVSVTDLDARLKKWVRLESVHRAPATPVAATGTHSRPSLSTPFVAPKGEVEQTIAEIWKDLLGVHPIGVHDKFFELGGHSLLAIQLISRLRDAFDVELPAHRLFEAPTVARLAQMVSAESTASPEAAIEDEQRMEELLQLVENLSEEEVQRLLDNQDASLGKGSVTNG